jgi:hypothetical protein
MPNPSDPPRPVPIDGKLVSLPDQNKTTTPPPGTPRVEYPAYGEEPIAPVPRKTVR